MNVVVTIKIGRGNPEIVLGRWESIRQEYSVIIRPSPLPARRTAILKVSRTDNMTSVIREEHVNGTTTTTTQLNLPFDKVVGRLPLQHLERDLVIPVHELKFCRANLAYAGSPIVCYS